jgi:hypothetical protein
MTEQQQRARQQRRHQDAQNALAELQETSLSLDPHQALRVLKEVWLAGYAYAKGEES